MKTKKLIPSIVFCIGLLFTSNTFATQEITQTQIDSYMGTVNDNTKLSVNRFDTIDECNLAKDANSKDPRFNSFTRSDCFKIVGINKYGYFACGTEYKGDLCKTGGNLVFGYEIDDSKKEVLDAFLDVFASAKDTEKYKNDINGYKSFLDNYISKFTEIKSTKTQKDVIAMNDYIIEGLKTIRQEAENSEADDFLNSIKKMTNDLKNGSGGNNSPERLERVTVTSGKCSQVKEAQTLSSNPALCEEGTISDFTSSSTGWSWKCIGNATAGSGQGPVDNCSATKKAELVNSESITPVLKVMSGSIQLDSDAIKLSGDGYDTNTKKITKGKTVVVTFNGVNGYDFVSWGGQTGNGKTGNSFTVTPESDWDNFDVVVNVKKQTNQESQKDCGSTFNGFRKQTALKNLETGEFTKNILGGYQSIVLICTNGELNYYPNGKDNTSTNCTEEGFEKNSAGTKCLEVVDSDEE